ncbi:hypothetical protein M2117_000356 [Aurantimicrobium minutum]|nr:hypothetical protein [Aurantimicrobium minutum]
MWITPADSQLRSIPSLTMTLDNLFHDLESQLERELDAELLNRLEDEERERRSKLTLRDRLIAIQEDQDTHLVSFNLTDEREITGTIKNIGKDWVAIEVDTPQELYGALIVSLLAIRSLCIPIECERLSLGNQVGEVTDSALEALSSRPRLAQKVNLAFVLRDIGRRRKTVTIATQKQNVRGTIDHVGQDHLDLRTSYGMLICTLREVLYVRIE